jgi:hypothetical protein
MILRVHNYYLNSINYLVSVIKKWRVFFAVVTNKSFAHKSTVMTSQYVPLTLTVPNAESPDDGGSKHLKRRTISTRLYGATSQETCRCDNLKSHKTRVSATNIT